MEEISWSVVVSSGTCDRRNCTYAKDRHPHLHVLVMGASSNELCVEFAISSSNARALARSLEVKAEVVDQLLDDSLPCDTCGMADEHAPKCPALGVG